MNPYLPAEAEVVERVQESPSVFTLSLELCDPDTRNAWRFAPRQFNMLYLYGVGEVPISIVSDSQCPARLGHTKRVVGRVTQGLARLRQGGRIGVRGPYERGWPLEQAQGRDVLIVTGGRGRAPVVSVINDVTARRASFGKLAIIQGVKHADDLLWRDRYAQWAALPDTQVLLSADQGGPVWPWHVGLVTDVFDDARIDAAQTLAMMCGPEGMMRASIKALTQRGIAEDRIYLSMERNMQCAVGHCGHCQYGPAFVEGSISTAHDLDRIRQVRANSAWLVTIGACATAGGVQALRGLADATTWIQGIYASPEYVDSLATSTPIAQHVKVDLELWGCPVNGRQVLGALRALLSGVMPPEEEDKVCMECKRRQKVCVMVAHGLPCMGPVTRTGCGALCPSFGRDCYGCYGPAENVNTKSLSRWLEGLGLVQEEVARRYLFINNGAPAFRQAGLAAKEDDDD